ncbi:MAG: hypothetical protein WCI55_04385 [Armatimonadota bacterium]
MRQKFFRLLVLIFVATLLRGGAFAQQVMIDHGLKVNDLWVFPIVNRPKEFLYLPQQGRLGTNSTGGPEFSFIRYVENSKSAGGGSISEANGGGVLHFLAKYDTDPDVVAGAQRELRKRLKDEEMIIRGPIVFSSGKYTIISSLAKARAGEETAVITGNAPVLEGNKIAIGTKLNKTDAQLLYNSLQQATPDLSVFFELQFQGVTDAYDATVTVDWSEVSKDETFRGGVRVYVVGADVDATFKRLFRNNAIKLVSRGESSSTEALLNTVYTKLLELMFRRTEDEPQQRQEMNIGQALSGLFGGGGSDGSSSGSILPISLSFGYRIKDMQTSGQSVLSFNHAAAVSRTNMIAFNVGPLFKKYGNDAAYFKAVNLQDPIYSQREVEVSVDGSVAQDFEKYINSVSIAVRKVHENGETTLGEVIVDKDSFAKNMNRYTVVYGNLGDIDREKWLNFEYKVRWSFRDGGSHQSEWIKTNDPFVNTIPPYERREIKLDGDIKKLKDQGIRFALVKVTYNFFGQQKTEQALIKTTDASPPVALTLIQPRGVYEYKYEIRYRKADGTDISKPSTKDDSGFILFDELPTPSLKTPDVIE